MKEGHSLCAFFFCVDEAPEHVPASPEMDATAPRVACAAWYHVYRYPPLLPPLDIFVILC